MDADRRRAWDDRHRAADGPGTPSSFVVDAVTALTAASPPLTPDRALDVACGRGRHALFLAARGWHVDAVDSSLPALVALRRDAATEGHDVRCIATDVTTWPIPPARYALVLVVSFLDRTILPAIRESVAPGGALVYQTQLRPNDGTSGMRPEFCLAPGELEALCDGWDVVLRRDDRALHRGLPTVRAGIAARRPPARH